MTTDPAVGDLVEYWNGYQYARSTVVRITASRVTLENGKAFSRRKYGAAWAFDVVPPGRLEFETKHAAWLDAKPAGKYTAARYDQRTGILASVQCHPERIDDVCAELQAIKTWAAAEPQEPSRR